MIAGVLTYSAKHKGTESDPPKIDSLFDQLCSKEFQPLKAIPHDTRQVYNNDGVGLIQQSMTQLHPQSIARCKESGQVCVCWARLDTGEHFKNSSFTHGDSLNNNASVILASYQKWQQDCVQYIKGDFVFAIYDPKQQHLLLARDRMGVRPLYYYQDQHSFAFASNPAAIAKLNDIENKVSTSWIAQHLFKHYTDSSSTAFSNIKKLPPGHILVINRDKSSLKSNLSTYWRLEDFLGNSNTSSAEDIIQTYRNHFDQAVSNRVQSKHPLAIELSGGLDSSSIMASMMEQSPDNEIHCLSRAYFSLEMGPIKTLHKLYPDTINHLWDDPNSDGLNYRKNLSRYIDIFGLPAEHSLAIGATNFMQTASQHNARILLSGYGGDEFSSSLAHDAVQQLFQQKNYLSAFMRLKGSPLELIKKAYRLAFSNRQAFSYQPAMLRMNHLDLLKVKQQQESYQRGLVSETNHNIRIAKKWANNGILRLESHTLAGSSMGISYHWPFLDEQVIACYLSSHVTERLGKGGKTRWLHRRAFSKSLPNQILDKNDKHIGSLSNKNDPHDVFMQSFPTEIDLHSALLPMVDTKVLNQFLNSSTRQQKQNPAYRHTLKTIYNINLWLNAYF